MICARAILHGGAPNFPGMLGGWGRFKMVEGATSRSVSSLYQVVCISTMQNNMVEVALLFGCLVVSCPQFSSATRPLRRAPVYSDTLIFPVVFFRQLFEMYCLSSLPVVVVRTVKVE
jgi:hypothetical protein